MSAIGITQLKRFLAFFKSRTLLRVSEGRRDEEMLAKLGNKKNTMVF